MLAILFSKRPISAPIIFPAIALKFDKETFKILAILISYLLTSTMIFNGFPNKNDLIISFLSTILIDLLCEKLY